MGGQVLQHSMRPGGRGESCSEEVAFGSGNRNFSHEVRFRWVGRTCELSSCGNSCPMGEAGDLNERVGDGERLMKKSNWKIRLRTKLEAHFKGLK